MSAGLPSLGGLPSGSIGRKTHRHGTHRTVAPEQTLARVSALCGAVGITRVSTVTGLDRIGIPVAVACRPNSRSLSVFQGKGLSPEAAKVSAIMEALEVHHAENVTGPLHFATTAEMRRRHRIAEPARLPRLAATGWDDHEPILWFEGRELTSGEPAWVPFELVNARFVLPHPPAGYRFAASTNGLASGNDPLEAILHGLYEAIERDAIALWLQQPRPARRLTALIPPAEGTVAAAMLARCAAAGIGVSLWDATSDIAVASVVCLLRAADESVCDMGSGCHADPGVALLRAVTEAAQSRLTRVSGAREDFGDEAYPGDPGLQSGQPAPDAGPGVRSLDALPDFATETLREDLLEVASRLAARGFDQAIVADLTDPALGIPVFRVVVPGLEGPAHSPAVAYAPGARALAATS